jgi:Cys-rich four helix bundle protein (predicted Tat secretion target)
MDRRDFVTGVSAFLVAAGAARAEDHAHGKDARPAAAPPPPLSRELKAVLEATGHCLQTGQLCVAHCNALLSTGDTSLAECQRTALNMLAVCDATFKAAAYHSADAKLLKALARVCGDFCRACAKACEVHAGHHEECKACMQSCLDCAKACDAYAA